MGDTAFALVFDHRSDNGPSLVGPFESREAAFEHLDGLESAECLAAPLVSPAGDRRQ